jgi:hypothetical protein
MRHPPSLRVACSCFSYWRVFVGWLVDVSEGGEGTQLMAAFEGAQGVCGTDADRLLDGLFDSTGRGDISKTREKKR